MDEKKDFTACKDYVILKLVKLPPKLSEGGIIIPESAQKEKDKYEAVVYDIGETKEPATFKIGDKVVFNQYDTKNVDRHGNYYVVCRAVSIMATYQ